MEEFRQCLRERPVGWTCAIALTCMSVVFLAVDAPSQVMSLKQLSSGEIASDRITAIPESYDSQRAPAQTTAAEVRSSEEPGNVGNPEPGTPPTSNPAANIIDEAEAHKVVSELIRETFSRCEGRNALYGYDGVMYLELTNHNLLLSSSSETEGVGYQLVATVQMKRKGSNEPLPAGLTKVYPVSVVRNADRLEAIPSKHLAQIAAADCSVVNELFSTTE